MTSLSDIKIDPNASPEIQNRQLEARISVQNKKLELKHEKQKKEWVSCCFKVDKAMVVFIVQTAVLASTLAYASVQLAYTDDCNKSRIWSSIMTMVIGIIMPAPRL